MEQPKETMTELQNRKLKEMLQQPAGVSKVMASTLATSHNETCY